MSMGPFAWIFGRGHTEIFWYGPLEFSYCLHARQDPGHRCTLHGGVRWIESNLFWPPYISHRTQKVPPHIVRWVVNWVAVSPHRTMYDGIVCVRWDFVLCFQSYLKFHRTPTAQYTAVSRVVARLVWDFSTPLSKPRYQKFITVQKSM